MTFKPDGLASYFWHTVEVGSPQSYQDAVEAINQSDIDVVSLQHEFGIFGGQDGDWVTLFAEGIKKPLVTTLHTTYPTFTPLKRNIVECLVKRSKAIIVLSEASRRFLCSQFETGDKVKLIRHGIPAVEFHHPRESTFRHELACDLVFVSAGHMRFSKGYETALSALALFKESGIKFRYLILGTSQPHWDPEGVVPKMLTGLVHELNLKEEVLLIPKFLPLEDLVRYIQAADIGLVTYTEHDQVSSGILPMILGCGRLAVATRFAFAESLAGSVDGLFFCELNDPKSLCEAIHRAAKHIDPASTIMRSNYDRTRDWLWENTAQRYKEVFEQTAVL
jgi:glycosyltransferase involved in cell wall biosynthesis